MFKKCQDQYKNNEQGYTLTEMVVVILIISLIAAVLTPSLLGQLSRSRAKTASLQIETTTAAIEMFRDDMGRYPTDQEGLTVLVTAPEGDGWLGPYLKSSKALNDPWGRPLVYVLMPEGGAMVTCLGADGKIGGKGVDGDIKGVLQ
jgi:general secretion pathway protein G